MNATIIATGSASNIVDDYSAQDAADDARLNLKVWVVVDEDGETMTGLMTNAQAAKFIIDMSMDVRPNAYKGWMSIVEKDVEVFTEAEEELFSEITELSEELHNAELSKALRSNGTPDFVIDRMDATIATGKTRFAKAMARLVEGGNEANQAYIRWRKLNK